MDHTQVTRQTSTTLPLRDGRAHDAPWPKPARAERFDGPLQLLLEGRGWAILRACADFTLLCAAVVAALGGVRETVHASAAQAPLLAMAPLAMALFYLRGLYRTRLHALVLDGVLPVLSAVSVVAVAAAAGGMLVNGRMPAQSQWMRAWLFSLLAVALGRVLSSSLQ
ncbi:MAG TPA: hypothetical protein VED41_03105, partial [Solirubrobacteraceae bacterium]|nr:hypothetical protein [Solirubrobacteraceae bacterium]